MFSAIFCKRSRMVREKIAAAEKPSLCLSTVCDTPPELSFTGVLPHLSRFRSHHRHRTPLLKQSCARVYGKWRMPVTMPSSAVDQQ